MGKGATGRDRQGWGDREGAKAMGRIKGKGRMDFTNGNGRMPGWT